MECLVLCWFWAVLRRFSKVLAETGGGGLLKILQREPVGTETIPKGHQKHAKGRPNNINKSVRKKGERQRVFWKLWCVALTSFQKNSFRVDRSLLHVF